METIKSVIQTKLPIRLKPRSKKLKEPKELTIGTVTADLEVPTASDIIFRQTWQIRRFHRTISRRDNVDSPTFRCSVNGVSTFWNVSIRFWKGPNGKKITNPVVICLNLTSCETEEIAQARVRFQFGVWDASIRHWECCPIADVVLNLNNTQDMLSVGYKSLGILERHINNAKDVSIMVKMQIIQAEEERHSLSQDLARLLDRDSGEIADTIVDCGIDVADDTTSTDSEKSAIKDDDKSTGSTNPNSSSENSSSSGSREKISDKPVVIAHSFMIKARSMVLGAMLRDHKISGNKHVKYSLDLRDVPHNVAREMFRYMYTDKVHKTEQFAYKLLPLSTRYCLAGLQSLCERTLTESLTPHNVGNILLLADQCGCDTLRKAALQYCEDSETIKGSMAIGKTLAWRVMEMVNPELFLEACESIASSSSAVDTPGSYSD